MILANGKSFEASIISFVVSRKSFLLTLVETKRLNKFLISNKKVEQELEEFVLIKLAQE
jgi:hypothetical protein